MGVVVCKEKEGGVFRVQSSVTSSVSGSVAPKGGGGDCAELSMGVSEAAGWLWWAEGPGGPFDGLMVTRPPSAAGMDH